MHWTVQTSRLVVDCPADVASAAVSTGVACEPPARTHPKKRARLGHRLASIDASLQKSPAAAEGTAPRLTLRARSFALPLRPSDSRLVTAVSIRSKTASES